MEPTIRKVQSSIRLIDKPEKTQVNTLIHVYSMGDEADDLLRSFALSEGDRDKYASVKDKFNGLKELVLT